jgi:hypothetical protein
LQGKGVAQDYAQAVTWLRKAADQGDAAAQRALGFMYENGVGVSQDYVQAHMWYNIAASRNTSGEKDDRDKAIASRDRVADKMTPEQITEAQKIAREWKPTSAPLQ